MSTSASLGHAVMVMILLGSGRSLKILRSRYQAYELIRARWAMLGAAGFVIPEALNKFGANCGPEALWFKTGALLLDGNTLNYFGKPIAINLIAAVLDALRRSFLVVLNTNRIIIFLQPYLLDFCIHKFSEKFWLLCIS